MNDNRRRLTGIALVTCGLTFNLPWILLYILFDYPAVVREPTGTILALYHEGGTWLAATWYALGLWAVLFAATVFLLFRLAGSRENYFTASAALVGALAIVVLGIGINRWLTTVPYMAEQFMDPATSAATRAFLVESFELQYKLGGIASSEFLWQLFVALWTGLASVGLANPALGSKRLQEEGLVRQGVVAAWLPKAGAFMMLMLLVALFAAAPSLFTTAVYILWSLWIAALGMTLLRAPVAA